MKRAFEGVLSACLLMAVICGADLIRALYPQSDMAQAVAAMAPVVTDWAAPDPENLALYGLAPFETELPVLFIDAGGERITKENKTWASVSMLNAAGAPRSIMETPDEQEAATIKLRGASSYFNFDKRQYRVKFYQHVGSAKAKDVALLGMGANSEWVLNGPFLDKTLVRNKLVYGLGREMFEWAPDCRYVELFLDGAYLGVYLAVEPVTNGASRLRLSEFGLLSGECAYIVKRERVDSEIDPLMVYGHTHGKTSNDLFMAYPPADKVTQRERDFVTRDISAFEEALYGEDFDDPALGYARYIDMDAFADYFILNEVTMNNDAGFLSTYPYKELGGKLKIAIWDYNNSFDNYQWFTQDFTEFFTADAPWFDRLLQDRAFVDRVVERYAAYRQGLLSNESVLGRVDACIEELGGAVERNFAVWGYTFQLGLLADGESRNPESYDDAVAQLKGAIEKRFAFLGAHMADLYENCIN